MARTEAQQAYNAARMETLGKLSDLRKALETHKKRSNEPWARGSFSYSGDLRNVNNKLAEILEFLNFLK